MTKPSVECPLCTPGDETIVWQDAACRVIAVADRDYPGYCRVIAQEHLAEMSDLPVAGQRHLMNVVLATELALRTLMRPDKINLASLGNKVPHLHWHVIPRFADDSHFPDAIWAAPKREGALRVAPGTDVLHDAIVAALTELTSG